ncbi:MAG: transcriptional repressor [Oscillospiraceae bacterium]|nr:transcriptional repressor [Oscillospiraceae bacterium]
MQTRQTFQKTLTLEAVREMQCHPTADQVYAYVAEKYPEISRATVYRNLNQLCDAGEIGRVKNPYGADRFDHIAGRHFHFICLSCGQLTNVDIPDISYFENLCTQQTGAQVTESHIFFGGLCKNCTDGQ